MPDAAKAEFEAALDELKSLKDAFDEAPDLETYDRLVVVEKRLRLAFERWLEASGFR